MANEKIIWNYFKNKGFTDAGIAGLMGNLYAESGLNPVNLQNSFEKKLGYSDTEYCNAVDNGSYTNFIYDSAGWGLAQWTFWSRKEAFLKYCQAIGKSIGDLNTQLDFLYQELNTGYSELINLLKTTNSVFDASTSFLLQFERPADQSNSAKKKRASYGQKYYTKCSQAKGGKNMKYNNTNRPIVCMMTTSTCYQQTTRMEVKGVLWHSTGANNPTIKRYVQPSDDDPNRTELLNTIGINIYGNDWNHIYHRAGLNCWIGQLADGTVATVQTMPWDYKPWGCGSGPKGSCNNGWIQFEICEDSLNDAEYFQKAYEEACQLTAYLCSMYGIDPNGTVSYNGIQVPTILCHADSNKLGLGSNHGDINHWFPKFGKSMETARVDVAAIMAGNNEIIFNDEDDDNMTQEKFNELANNWIANLAAQPATWEAAAMQWAVQNGLFEGDENGNLMPKKFLTRGEFATVLQRYSDKK